MSSSTLEIARQAYEDIEVYERAIGEQLSKKPKTTKQQIWQQHHIKNLVGKIQDQSGLLVEGVLRDEDGSFKAELEAMKGHNAFGSFYQALKETKDYHAKYSVDSGSLAGPSLEADMRCAADFSGEERWGKYVDLLELHERAMNLRGLGLPQLDYADFLEQFHKLGAQVPRAAKSSSKYAAYVTGLRSYLMGFLERTQPLLDLASLMAEECDKPFEAAWAAGTVEGWAGGGYSAGASAGGSGEAPANKKPVDLCNVHSVKDAKALGMSRLKEGLDALGLKSGGNLDQRAERLFKTKGLEPSQLPKKLLKPRASNAEKNGKDGKAFFSSAKDRADEGQGAKRTAHEEAVVAWLAGMLDDVLSATKKHVEKKHSMLLEERLAELEAEDAAEREMEFEDKEGEGEEEEEEEDDGPLYNPLNLPLGWDGKPIPFWLYKLHGLGVEYKCEICGNQSYWGRRAFDKHFQEWRHAYGMRCLGIPNTKHFHDICLIEDAVSLYSKLQSSVQGEQFDAAAEEEYEDSDGHVLNRKTYEDLARQGLL